MAAQRSKDLGNEVSGESADSVPVTKEDLTGIAVTLIVEPLDGVYEASVTMGYTINVGNYESRKVEATYAGKFSMVHSAEDIGEHLMDKAFDSIKDELDITKIQARANPKSIVHNLSTD